MVLHAMVRVSRRSDRAGAPRPTEVTTIVCIIARKLINQGKVRERADITFRFYLKSVEDNLVR